jgi:cell division protein FtsW (lipid II flippase)
MKNRASSHLLLILLILGLEIMGYIAVHRAGLLRGYETSVIGAVRDLLMFLPLMMVAIWLSRYKRFAGNWVLFSTAILLFAFGMLIQYRLYSDPEYNARNKAAAREEKMQALRTRYIMENYDAHKKQMMGLPPTPAQPVDIDTLPKRESTYSLWNAITSSYTWIPIFSFFAFAVAYSLCTRDGFLLWLQRNSFIIVLFTLLPLAIAVVTSSAGKALGNMTPWEPSKVPFLVGFAGILTARYKDLAETYWGVPRARDIVPLLVMAILPFVPFFALKDFGQMLIFSGAYTTLYLVAVRRWPQLLLFVGSVFLVISILVVGALPVGQYHGAARPGLDRTLLTAVVHLDHLLHEVLVDERAFFDRPCHYFFLRWTMNLLDVFFLCRVRKPLASWPQGDFAWPPLARPSPPPMGWSTGFCTTPRTWGRLPR